jgi:HTH-type transcriptional regulator/antitoxin HigA
MQAPETDVTYVPTEAIAPGETLRETLDALDMNQVQFAQRTGLSTKHVNQLLQGGSAITPETSLLIERVTGVPARFWNTLESDYRDTLGRLSEDAALEGSQSWLAGLPTAVLRELRKMGYLTATRSNDVEAARQLLQFFGVSSVASWNDVYAQPAASFLQSPAFQPDTAAVAAWLRLGEIEGTQIQCESYSRNALRSILPELRSQTLETPDVFWPQLQALCASAGVAVALVSDIPGTRASGATRWLTPRKALIQLSNRGKRNDKFWFAFFHEIGHVLLHGKKDVFLDDIGKGTGSGSSRDEAEANEFAGSILIPKERDAELQALKTNRDVKVFAKTIGVAPGVVAGRLQHDRKAYGAFADLFEKYVLAED